MKLKSSGSAWGHAKETGAPKSLLAKHKSGGVWFDPAKGPAPNKGQTARGKGGEGKGSPKE